MVLLIGPGEVPGECRVLFLELFDPPLQCQHGIYVRFILLIFVILALVLSQIAFGGSVNQVRVILRVGLHGKTMETGK